MHDREAFIEQKKKSRRDRQKEEQALAKPKPQPANLPTTENKSSVEEPSDVTESEIPRYRIWDFDDDN